MEKSVSKGIKKSSKNQPQNSWTALFTTPFINHFSTLIDNIQNPVLSLYGTEKIISLLNLSKKSSSLVLTRPKSPATPGAHQEILEWSDLVVVYMGVSKNNGIPKSSISIGVSIINHPCWGTPIIGNTHMSMMPRVHTPAKFVSARPWKMVVKNNRRLSGPQRALGNFWVGLLLLNFRGVSYLANG